jgi:hypothetical protein
MIVRLKIDAKIPAGEAGAARQKIGVPSPKIVSQRKFQKICLGV